MENITVQYLNELDVAVKSIHSLQKQLEDFIEAPIIDKSCLTLLLQKNGSNLEPPFEGQAFQHQIASHGIAVGAGCTLGLLSGSLLLAATFTGLSYAAFHFRKEWLCDRIEGLLYRNSTKRHLLQVAASIKYLDALGVRYNKIEVKQLLFKALRSKQNITPIELLQLTAYLWYAFVDNPDITVMRQEAFDSLYVPNEFSKIQDADDDPQDIEDEYLNLLLDTDDMFDTVKDDADELEDRFSSLFGSVDSVDEHHQSNLDGLRFRQELNQTANEKLSDTSMEKALSSALEENDQKPEATILENPFEDDQTQLNQKESVLVESTPNKEPEEDKTEPSTAPQTTEIVFTESKAPSDNSINETQPITEEKTDLLNASLDELLSHGSPSGIDNDDGNAETKELASVNEPFDLEEESNEPSASDDSSIPDFLSSLDADDDLPDFAEPDNTEQDDDEDDEFGDSIDSAIHALEEDAKSKP